MTPFFIDIIPCILILGSETPFGLDLLIGSLMVRCMKIKYRTVISHSGSYFCVVPGNYFLEFVSIFITLVFSINTYFQYIICSI